MPLEIGAMTELNLKMVVVLQMRRTVKKKTAYIDVDSPLYAMNTTG